MKSIAKQSIAKPEIANGLHQAFRVGVYVKLFNGALQTLGGLLLIVAPPTYLHDLLRYLAHFNDQLTPRLHYFAVTYLLAHGLTKLFLGVNLLRNRLWAYQVFGLVLAVFILYQVYQLGYAWSAWMLGLTIFDTVFLVLTAWEYRQQQALARAEG